MWTRLCYGKKDKPFNYSEFICDSKEDLIELPTNKSPSNVNKNILSCSIGSIALCISEKQFFILNNVNEWKLFKDNNLNDSSSNLGNIDIVTVDELQDYLNI